MEWDDNSIMNPGENTGNIIITEDSVFSNAKCLFVEYSDVLKIPMFVGMYNNRHNEYLREIVDLSNTDHWGTLGWLEWYFLREHRNPLENFPLLDDSVSRSDLNDIVDTWMDDPDVVRTKSVQLAFVESLWRLVYLCNVVEEIVIYSRKPYMLIAEDIADLFHDKVRYMTGELEEIIPLLPEDTTYIFSDIQAINTLLKLNRLNYSSVLVPEEYQYNYNGDELKVDIKELLKTHIFKFGLISNDVRIV